MPSGKKNVQYIAIEDLAADLGIFEQDARGMLKRLSPATRIDHRGREAVPATCIAQLTNTEDYSRALARALAAERWTRREDKEQEG